MVQLQILSGRKSGSTFDSSSLPVTMGRSQQSDVSLEEPGVWPSHCKIQWRSEGLVLELEPGRAGQCERSARAAHRLAQRRHDHFGWREPALQFKSPSSSQRGFARMADLGRAGSLVPGASRCHLLAESLSQWRKWRVPVKTIAMSYLSAAAITSASLTEPPG